MNIAKQNTLWFKTNDSVASREVPDKPFTRVLLVKDPGDGVSTGGKWMGVITVHYTFDFAGRKNPTL
jgi:hypothetical protein